MFPLKFTRSGQNSTFKLNFNLNRMKNNVVKLEENKHNLISDAFYVILSLSGSLIFSDPADSVRLSLFKRIQFVTFPRVYWLADPQVIYPSDS